MQTLPKPRLQRFVAFALLTLIAACSGNIRESGMNGTQRADLTAIAGFIDLFWDQGGGRLLIDVRAFDEPFIYQSSLPRGVGSNDLGLDRGQLGATRIVRFIRSGPKVLLVQNNVDYRATSSDADERRAVAESFARSVIWGFEIQSEDGESVLIDGTDFFLRDAHDLSTELAASEEGEYLADISRSAIYLPRTKAFPDNTEVEAILTYVGRPAGQYLPTVVPDPSAVTVHSHHSFIRLPDDDYEPLPYDPRSGVIGFGFGSPGVADYASPLGEPLFSNYGRRHRLRKMHPDAEVSEAVEPIVYYVDRGAPEPIRSALIEGAGWWNQAFEAAGFKNAYQVKLLPAGADPMDVRFNVIQWVHRSTRGWSYGSSVIDPRSGEILKGHVTLGSLRVRQDYLIAEGLLAPYTNDSVPNAMLQMALARIRQLAAHEVGHTLGLEHNFAASTQDRASVMDYPFPRVRFDEEGALDLSDAYAIGIGEWDKRAVLFAYQDFKNDVNRNKARADIMKETIAAGYAYVADDDSRAVGSAHPDGNLWDNGADAVAELEHLLEVRAYALARLSDQAIRIGRPEATIEEVLVPIYLLHRYQLHAVSKLIGGTYFNYNLRGDAQDAPKFVSKERQQAAIQALIRTLHPEQLRLPVGLAERIPPRPPGHPKSSEVFYAQTGPTFDSLAPAASAAALALEVLLNPQRAARMNRIGTPGFGGLIENLMTATWRSTADEKDISLQQQTNMLFLDGLLRLAVDAAADIGVQAVALRAIDQIYEMTAASSANGTRASSYRRLARFKIERFQADPGSVEALPVVTIPPGSPIGSEVP